MFKKLYAKGNETLVKFLSKFKLHRGKNDTRGVCLIGRVQSRVTCDLYPKETVVNYIPY